MNQLFFCVQWHKNKATSWSGTHYSVFKELSKRYDLVEYDYGIKKPYTFLTKLIYDKILHKYSTSSISSDKINKHYYNQIKKVINKNNLNKSFQFKLYPNIDNVHSYVYVDCLYCYLKYIYDNDIEAFKYWDDDISKVEKELKHEEELLNKDNVTIFTMSRCLHDYLINIKKLSHNKVFFVGGGINLKYTEVDFTKKNGKRFLFSGKNFERKNGPLVVEAFKKVKEKYPESELYISGCNVDIKEENVHVLGLLNFEHSSEYFKLCDYFVMPSIFEAYGLVFPEALSYGLPIIGRNAFEMPYFIKDGENGYILNSQNSDELASLMIKMIENKEMSKFVLGNRKKYYDYYSWSSVVDRMCEVINLKGE